MSTIGISLVSLEDFAQQLSAALTTATSYDNYLERVVELIKIKHPSLTNSQTNTNPFSKPILRVIYQIREIFKNCPGSTPIQVGELETSNKKQKLYASVEELTQTALFVLSSPLFFLRYKQMQSTLPLFPTKYSEIHSQVIKFITSGKAYFGTHELLALQLAKEYKMPELKESCDKQLKYYLNQAVLSDFAHFEFIKDNLIANNLDIPFVSKWLATSLVTLLDSTSHDREFNIRELRLIFKFIMTQKLSPQLLQGLTEFAKKQAPLTKGLEILPHVLRLKQQGFSIDCMVKRNQRLSFDKIGLSILKNSQFDQNTMESAKRIMDFFQLNWLVIKQVEPKVCENGFFALVESFLQTPQENEICFQKCSLSNDNMNRLIEVISSQKKPIDLIFKECVFNADSMSSSWEQKFAGISVLIRNLSFQGSQGLIDGREHILEALKTNSHLQELDLSRTGNISPKFVKDLQEWVQNNQSLISLNLSSLNFSSGDLQTLFSALKMNSQSKLKSLDLSCQEQDAGSLKALGEWLKDKSKHSLKTLVLSEAKIPDELLSQIGRILGTISSTGLSYIDISGNNFMPNFIVSFKKELSEHWEIKSDFPGLLHCTSRYNSDVMTIRI